MFDYVSATITQGFSSVSAKLTEQRSLGLIDGGGHLVLGDAKSKSGVGQNQMFTAAIAKVLHKYLVQ